MREDRLWQKICAHVLSVFLILGMLGTGLPAIGALSPQEAYAADAPEIMVLVDSAAEQPAENGSYRWAFFGADESIDIAELSADDFSMQVKVGDGEWTAAPDVGIELVASDEYDGVVEAAVPDNKEAVTKQWRFVYAGGILDWSYEEVDCPAITQAAAAAAAEPAISAATVDPAVVDKYSDEVTVYVTGSDLKKVWYRAFRYSEEDDYWYRMGDGYNAPSVDAKSAESAEIKFAPTEEAGTYRIYVMAADPGTGDLNVSSCDSKYEGVEWTVRSDAPKASITGAAVAPGEVDSASSPVTLTVSGENLDTVWYTLFYCEPGDDFWMNGGTKSFSAASAAQATAEITPTQNADKFRVYVMTKDPGYTYYSEASCKSAGFKSADWSVKAETPSTKPALILSYESDDEQPAAGGEYIWAADDTSYTAEFTDVESGDFKAQVKAGEGEWEDSNAAVTWAEDPQEMSLGLVSIDVPDNEEAVVKQWRVTYAGGIVNWGGQPEDCAPITQAAAEVVSTKPEIDFIEIDDYMAYMSGETQPAADGVYAWYVDFPEGSATSDITDADFTMQMKTDDSDWADSTDASAHFDFNENGAWVVATVPDNTEGFDKQWRFVYSGGGEECPAITQEAAEITDPLEEAKEEAKAELEDIDTSKYSGDEKTAVEAAISKALEDIEAAESVDAVDEALSTAQTAIAAQKTNVQKAEDAETVANDAKTAADTAAATAAESKAAAYEAAKTPGQAAVDAAEKAKTDAEAAKAAAETYKEAAEAYAAAAELAYGETSKKTQDAKQAATDAATAAGTAAQAATDAAAAVDTAKADKEKADQAAADAKAKKVKTVTVNVANVNAKAVDSAVKKAGGSEKYVTKIVLGKKVKKVSAKTFAKYKKVTTIELKTKKLSKKSVKSSLKSSKVKTVRVKVGSKKVNKKYVKKYKKIFTKKIAGKKVRVK